MNVLNNYEQHPLIFSHGVLGFQGYPGTDLFCVLVNGDNNFLSYGIVENSLLIVNRKEPLAPTALNVLNRPSESWKGAAKAIAGLACRCFLCGTRHFIRQSL